MEKFPRAKGFEYQVLVFQLGMEFGPHLPVINSKFQVLVGFEPLTKVANTGPKVLLGSAKYFTEMAINVTPRTDITISTCSSTSRRGGVMLIDCTMQIEPLIARCRLRDACANKDCE